MCRLLICQKSLFRVCLVSIVCTSLLLPSIPLSTSEAAPGQSAERGRPRPGKPEGVWPDLEDIKRDSNTTREPAPPIPSTIRSAKNPMRPWNGRRVGDPGTQGELVQAGREQSSKVVAQAGKKLAVRGRDNRTRRAHVSRNVAPPSVLDDQFIASFFAWALVRSPSGVYYSYNSNPFGNDTASYANNRRSNWAYNADGQVISTPSTNTDLPRTMTYDAAGRLVSTVETSPTSTVTYSAAYDGDGKLVRETSSVSPGTSQLSYIIRSSMLGGEVLTRLDASGNKLTTHVPAEGLLFATQRSSGAPGPFVMLTQRNPLGITETNKAVYDPLGNYIPFQAYQDPRPPAGSYNSASMGGLSSSQANPESYAVGCMMDGMPTDCNRVMQTIDRDHAESVDIRGLALTPSVMRLMASALAVNYTRKVQLNPDGSISDTITPGGETGHVEWGFEDNYASWVITRYVFAPGRQNSFEGTPTRQDPDDSDLNNPDSKFS